jgi:putative CocE/NonD family hydrolase
MGLQVTTSEFRSQTYPGDTFGLHDPLSWTFVINIQRDAPILISLIMRMLGQEKKLKPAFEHLPLGDADTILLNKKVHFWQDWLNNSKPPYEWWNPADFSTTVPQVQVPINMVGGWFDIFLPWQLKDYSILKKADQSPFLLVGPWFHTSLALYRVCTQEALSWFRAHLLGDRSLLRQSPVRLFVMGKGKWHDFPEWPPPGYLPQKWYLHQNRQLSIKIPAQSDPDCYSYNPANPTPSVGGVMMGPEAGSKDNRKQEMRPDILVYSGDVLKTDLEVIGSVQAHLYIKSNLEYTDFFCRLCDVYPSGKSMNICDGILRLRPGRPAQQTDGCKEIDIELWPTAYCFRKGHRIRLQIASGAHPRFARNLGTGEPLATATTMHIAEQQIYHDPDHPSAISLPVKG